MSLKEILNGLNNRKEWVGKRLTTIDSILDKDAYDRGSSITKEEARELNNEYDSLQEEAIQITSLSTRIKDILKIDENIAKLNEQITENNGKNELILINEEITSLQRARDILYDQIREDLPQPEQPKITPKKR